MIDYSDRLDFNRPVIGINTDFSPITEAKPFAHMYRTGQMTLKEVKELLLMTDEQKAELLEDAPLEKHAIKTMQAKRHKTWQAFQAMIANPQGVH